MSDQGTEGRGSGSLTPPPSWGGCKTVEALPRLGVRAPTGSPAVLPPQGVLKGNEEVALSWLSWGTGELRRGPKSPPCTLQGSEGRCCLGNSAGHSQTPNTTGLAAPPEPWAAWLCPRPTTEPQLEKGRSSGPP